MKKEILEMFDHFRVSTIVINKKGETNSFWEEVIGDQPFTVIHNANVKGVAIIGRGEYPVKGEDIPIGDHLRMFECIKNIAKTSKGRCIDFGENILYYA